MLRQADVYAIHTRMQLFQIQYMNKLKRLATFVILIGVTTGCSQRQTALSESLQQAQRASNQENWTLAQDYLLAETEENPNSITAQVNLALIQWRTGQLNDAIATFNKITQRDTVPTVIWQYYGQLMVETGNPLGAREILARIDPPTPESLTISALADMKMNSLERAKLNLENALSLNPDYAPAWYNLAILYRDQMPNKIEAQIAWSTFKKTAPNHPYAQMSNEDFFGEAVETNETLPEIAPTPTNNIPDPQIAPQEEPNQTDAIPTPQPQPTPPDDISKTLNKIQALITRGETDSALIMLKQTVRNNPDNPDAVWELARFYDVQLGIQNRAEGLYKTFSQLFPDDPRCNQIPSSVQTQTNIRSPTPDSDQNKRRSLLFQKGMKHYSKKEWDDAITSFRRVLSIDPKDAGAAFNLGLTYHKTGDLDAAAAAFRQALETEPNMVKSLYMLGLIERDRGNISISLQLLNRVIRMQPDFAKAHHALGRIYLKEGRPDMTAIHFQRILEIDPSTQEAQTARAWLDKQE